MPRTPVYEVRRGLIVARVWRRRTRSGLRHTVTIVRLFRNGDTWKESTRFGRDDIPLIRLALDEAYEWIYEHSQQIES
jgi:hypothetical protein